MDRALDEVISDRQRSNHRGGGRGNRRRDNRRDGNRKNDRETANLDDEWIHDKYDEDEDGSRRPARQSRPSRYDRASPEADLFGRDRDRDRGTKIRVENLHWDLNETDLSELFERIGPISRLSIDYDRAGRSTGTAYVTYRDSLDARDAVRQFDGANAKGQPIRLTIVPSGPNSRGGRNPLESAHPPSRSLLDRIEGGRDASRSQNRDRNRSRSPGRKRADLRAAARDGIDRYVPNDRSRSRSPRRRANRGGAGASAGVGTGAGAGRRPRGGGQDRRGGRVDDQGHNVVNGRPRMTQEELDRDMDNYFKSGRANGGDNSSAAATNASPTAPVVSATSEAAGGIADDDIDMIE